MALVHYVHRCGGDLRVACSQRNPQIRILAVALAGSVAERPVVRYVQEYDNYESCRAASRLYFGTSFRQFATEQSLTSVACCVSVFPQVVTEHQTISVRCSYGSNGM